MLFGWRHQLFPRTFATVIGQELRNSSRRVNNELYSIIVLSRLQTRSFSGRFAALRFPQRKIHNLVNAIDTNAIGKRDRYNDNRIRTFQSQNRDCKRVLIVGGGPTGLFLAHLLRSYNVPFRLIEAQTPEQRFKHPQAHFLNTRTMEILKHGLSYNKTSNSDRPNEVYEEIRNTMPPVEEWKSFRFGPDMTSSSEKGTIMAEVVHPVDRPLAAESDANGRLVLKMVDRVKKVAETENDKRNGIPLSPESVGHLAQHKFCRILYDALAKPPETAATTSERTISNDNGDSESNSDILYGRGVTGFDWNEETNRWTIKTDRKEIFDDVDIILGADGAASTVRKNLFPGDETATRGKDSTMLGTPNLQRLINVHFEISAESTPCENELTNKQQQRKIPPAMLYTVFNPEVLAMVVRHGPGEYVLQIPYFEPYQTPEEDFSIPKVRKMVRSILGDTDDFIIHSVRPWTMGSLVARNYYTEEGVILVGDAAHVFPPAGGFGMNTGLQDAYSLAWRIALNRQQEQQKQEQKTNKIEGTDLLFSPSTVGHIYERERQPIARRNAALSVRNYQRVLNVMRACYLDDRHPALLIQVLDATNSFIPLEMRRKTFRTMLQTALSPLSQLQTSPNGFYTRTIKDNLRMLLGSGQGLPLLFPRHELDFSYDESSRLNKEDNETNDSSQDSIASTPQLIPGMLFPHVVASVPFETLQRFPRLQPIEDDDESLNDDSCDRFITSTDGKSSRKVSTRDLAAQLASKKTPLAFCLLEIVSSSESEVDETLSSVKMTLEGQFGIPFLMSRLVVSRSRDDDREQIDPSNHDEAADTTICDLYVGNRQWEALNLFSASSGTSSSTKHFVVIRPDGHVAAISSKGVHTENLIVGIQTSVTGK